MGKKEGLLLFFVVATNGTVEDVAEVHHIGTSVAAESLERSGLGGQLLFGVVCGLDRKTETTLVAVDLDHASRDLVAGIDHVLHLVDAILADLRNVDETVDTILELHEGAEGSEFRNGSSHDVADLEVSIDVAPWILSELLHAEADALMLGIDVEHDGVDFVGLLEDLGWVIDLAGPAHVGDVNHTVDTLFEFDEGTIGGHVAHLAVNASAHWVVVADHVPRIRLELTQAE